MKPFRKTLILFASIAWVSSCSQEPSQNVQIAQPRNTNQIWNGLEIKANQLVPMAVLRIKGGSTCTATLIGPRVIITAGHCSSDLEATVGPINGKLYRVISFAVHPLYVVGEENINIPYDYSIKHDLALGLLDNEVFNVTPVSVTDQTASVGDWVYYAGEGLPDFGRKIGSSKVVTASSIGLTLRAADKKASYFGGGDSGGPHFIKKADGTIQLFAVTSTSTRNLDKTSFYNWPEALPFTMGIVRVMPGQDLFLKNYAKANSIEICGINIQCDPVRWPE